jgi:UDP-3-O-[3-hydroxymyristoyl] glucosamine N-acyltransferase
MSFNLTDIERHLKLPFTVLGNKELTFDEAAPVFEVHENSLTWIRSLNPNKDALARETHASYIICDNDFSPDESLLKTKCFIRVERPDVAFLRLVKNLYQPGPTLQCAIHPTAIVHPRASLGLNVSIGPYAVVGNCEVGDHSIIGALCTISAGVRIGSRALISEHCNIGGQGFGHIKNESNKFENMLHIGTVIVEDEVELFPYTNVDRATLSVTRIGRGTKIDHYCHIGHNTRTGENTIITAKVVLCGGSCVGDSCLLGVGSLIRDNVSVGNGAVVGMGSIVTRNIPENETWAGNPARPLEELKEMLRNTKKRKATRSAQAGRGASEGLKEIGKEGTTGD